ncbi:MAG: thiamine-phosphate kinase [Cellvibrionales bacterium]|nr:thiamine-phosphate kinase [Cellvibrionales bacterium]
MATVASNGAPPLLRAKVRSGHQVQGRTVDSNGHFGRGEAANVTGVATAAPDGESDLIHRYFAPIAGPQPGVITGIGDDAAVLEVTNERLLVSTDSMVEGVHFPPGAAAARLARRLLRVNLSDLAAMAARPRWFTLNLTLPIADPEWLAAFSDALHREAAQFGCCLVGGDTTRGPLNLAVQIMGTVAAGGPVLNRRGARPGDWLVVTGTLGDAAAALELDLNAPLADNHFLRRYWLPTPRLDFAQAAAAHIRAACDISDGLLRDAGHLCAAGEVAATVHLEAIPLSDPLRERRKAPQYLAATGGDDYELCLAVAPADWPRLAQIARRQQLALTRVGEFVPAGRDSAPVRLFDSAGREVPVENPGYRHF